jgi:PAS domain S-box-containing protein
MADVDHAQEQGVSPLQNHRQASAPAPRGMAEAPLVFLREGGAMGALIRAHDWAATPLGRPEQWPQSLRTAVRLMLSTNHPMFIFWGEHSICLYNDGYSASLGPEKHPAILGRPGVVAWPEIWQLIGPQIELVMAGRGATWHRDHLVPIVRHGALDEAYWTYSYSPIDDETAENGVGGVMVICTETTDRVLADRRHQFLAELSDRLRALVEPAQVLAAAAEALGTHLDASSVGYAEVDATGLTATVERDWVGLGGAAVVGTHRLDDFGSALMQELRRGNPIMVSDVARDARLPPATLPAYAALGVGAMILAPLVQEERLRGILFVHHARPRLWRPSDEQLVVEVAARTAAALASARARRAQVENERMLRAIGDSSGQLIFAKDRAGRLLYANAATLAVIGQPIETVLGRTDLEWHGGDEAREIVENDRRVLTTGESLRVEERFTTPDGAERLYEGIKAPMRDETGAIVGVVGVASDVTERNRQQRHLRLMVDELNHRVKNTLAIVQSIAHQTFRHLDLPTEARRAFEERLAALANAHSLLTRESWESAELADVAAEACAAYMGRDGRVLIEGPSLRITPKTAVTIAMALHELSTNAAKYGALSNEEGRVRLSWTLAGRSGPRLHLRWEERGGPAVARPTRRGFGSRMIEQALAAELQGEVRMAFLPQGLVCEIDAPIPEKPVR